MNKLLSVFTLVLLAMPLGVVAQRPLPQGEFACHVITVTGEDGLILVQAASVDRARAAALGAEAAISSAERVQAAEVVECIPRARGRFSSRAATELLSNLMR